MTTERDRIYRSAISGALKDPAKLRALADAFEREKLYPQAQLLRQRAALRELPPEIKSARRQVWRKAMVSKDKRAVLALADAYEKEGCTTAAQRLRTYASGLPDVRASAEPIVTPPPRTPEQANETPTETVHAQTDFREVSAEPEVNTDVQQEAAE
jgi:hypothetical protein